MKALALMLLPLFSLAACATALAPVPAAQRAIPTGQPLEVLQPGFDRAAHEHDLLVTARDRFGEANVRRALAAPTYLFAKYYHGMLPPPLPGEPPYRPPMALLMRDNGRWLTASSSGFRPVSAATALAIDALIAAPGFWSVPEWTEPRCTDAGAAVLMLKVPGRPEIIRRGSCGETEPTQRLVLLAVG